MRYDYIFISMRDLLNIIIMPTRQLLFKIIGVTLVILFLAGCGRSVPGIDTPIATEDITLQIVSLTEQDTYEDINTRITPKFPNDVCMFVKATINSKNPITINIRDFEKNTQLLAWAEQFSVTDGNGRTSKPHMTSASAALGLDKIEAVTWLFVVARGSRSFTLHLPGGKSVPLDTLLAKERKRRT